MLANKSLTEAMQPQKPFAHRKAENEKGFQIYFWHP